MAQDFMGTPESNPTLFHFKKKIKKNNEKLLNQEDTMIYQYDTLELPFIDDFSRDHFPEKIFDINNSRINQSIKVYSILINGFKYLGTEGFRSDTTFQIVQDPEGNELFRNVNVPLAIEFNDISKYPISTSNILAFPPYNIILDTTGNPLDTIPLEPNLVQDSIVYHLIDPDPNDFYIDRLAYLNNTFALDPPSIGVVTFDGLDEFGEAYDIDNDFSIQGDRLTSVPINLSGLPDTNVFFSFYYEPQGLSTDKVDPEDSLTLDFYNSQTKTWVNVWRQRGYERNNTFRQKIIKVPNKFHQNAFQFRFRSYASTAGAFDQWHIDYLYLNHGRNEGDTIYNDIAYQFDAPSHILTYTAMPWFHFNSAPSQYMKSSVESFVINSSLQDQEVRNKIVMLNENDPINDYYQYPTNLGNVVSLPANIRFKFDYPINFSYPAADIKGETVFESVYDIRFNQQGGNRDFIRTNDTIIGKTVLKDYYAYDDGTAETGYGIEPQLGSEGFVSYLAVEYNIPFKDDSVGGVQMYFIPKGINSYNQQFQIMIWNSINPTQIHYSTPFSFNPMQTDDNGFLTYYFDSLVQVNQTFYIGIRQVGRRAMTFGYDRNTNSRSKIFWSQNGFNWNSPSPDIKNGSVMIRPVFNRTARGVGIYESDLEESAFVYPNPAVSQIHIELNNSKPIRNLIILDISGREIYHGNYQNSIDVSSFKEGIYFMKLINESGSVISKKFLISR